MNINNNFNVLPFYDNLQKQNRNKWYSFGQHYPLICPNNIILPFQFVITTEITFLGNIEAVSVDKGTATNLGVKPEIIQGAQGNSSYYVVKKAETTINAMPDGLHYLRINTNQGYLYSEEFVFTDSYADCIRLEYWNEDTLNFTSGEINFDDDFKFVMYIPSTIGKPEYEFEEELTKRLGYKFIESQTSNKLYKFNFLAPEYICDAMRLVRLCDYIKLTTKYDTYNALTFSYEPKWQENGDLAAVDVEFETDSIIQKLESFNRRLKESFYNALLADIDEPILFSTDTVAQYYTEFTSTSYINGKLIRQLEALSKEELLDNLYSLVLPIDNQIDTEKKAKKIFLSDILNSTGISDATKMFRGHFDLDGNIEWIEALAPIGVNGGVTMFIDNGTIPLPQLWAGLPIDGNTLIRDERGVLMVNPDITLGGGTGNLPDLSAYAKKEDLNLYIPIADYTGVTGKKNFLSGLQVGGLSIDKSQDDVIYIDANLVVRGGITMYATDTVDIPSLLDSIPVASNTTKGLASFDATYFSVDKGHVTLLPDNVGLNETELAAYLDDKKYATQYWVQSLKYATSTELDLLEAKVNDFLSGSDADNIINKWKELETFLKGLTESDNLATILGTKANKATTIAGYGITDAYTKSDVNTLLGNYVTLATAQTITGKKDFTTGGLFVNGKQIQYIPIDSDSGYWKLEGDLLVTGGVTMYGGDSAFTPSTIMSAIVADGTNLKVIDGVLTFVGETGGGLTEVHWDDVIGRPTLLSSFICDLTIGKMTNIGSWADTAATEDRLMYQAANSTTWSYKKVSEFVSQTGAYLPLSGGQMIGNIGYTTDVDNYTIGIPAAGMIDVYEFADFLPTIKAFVGSVYQAANTTWYNVISIRHRNGYGDGNKYGMYIQSHMTAGNANLYWNRQASGNWQGDRLILDSVNFSNYTLPLTGGTLSGSLTVTGILDIMPNTNNYSGMNFFLKDGTAYHISNRGGETNKNLRLYYYNTSSYVHLIDVTTNGKVGVGTTAPALKVHIVDTTNNIMHVQSTSHNEASIVYTNASNHAWVAGVGAGAHGDSFGIYSVTALSVVMRCLSNRDTLFKERTWIGESSIGFNRDVSNGGRPDTSYYGYQIHVDKTSNELWFGGEVPSWKVLMRLSANGLLVTGGITMYSDIRKKTKLQDVELSLSQIANAPLIEHYYNSDDKRTTHVGSIAQYWAGMNDWFCKLDNEGYYTMEIQNAALASAISVARHLQKYETETDGKIRMMKKRIKELENKVEQLEKLKAA